MTSWARYDTAAKRLDARTQKGEGCWFFTGRIDRYGYGVIRVGHKTVKAHRLAYEFSIGRIPVGLTIDHLCHNGTGCPGGTSCPHRACVNPAHMEAVAFGVNVLRGGGPSARAARQTHCINGHLFYGKNGRRKCRTCAQNRYQAMKQAQLA